MHCSSPTDSKDDDSDNTDGNSFAEQVIGSDGGTVETETLSLSVPPGAFSSSNEITVEKKTGSVISENSVSDQYTVSGIPADFSQQIQIKIRHTGELKNTTLVTVGQEVTNPFFGTATMAYTYLSAREESGMLVTSISPISGITGTSKMSSSQVGDDLLTFYIEAITDMETVGEGSHFTIVLPNEYLLLANSLKDVLEETYTMFLDYGFSYNTPNSLFVPLDSILVERGRKTADFDILALDFPKGWNKPATLRFENKYIPYVLDSDVRVDTIAAFFMLIQQHNHAWAKANRWFNSAVLGWVKRRFNTVQDYLPRAYEENPFYVFDGIDPGTGLIDADEVRKGESAAVFIEYIDKHYNILQGDRILKHIHDEFRDNVPFVDAVSKLIQREEEIWWPDFLKEFMTGSLFPIDASDIIDDTRLSGSFTATASDTAASFAEDYGSFQSRLYRIGVDSSLSDDLDYIRFTATSSDVDDKYLSVMVFGIKNGKLSYIDHRTDLGVGDIENYTDNGSLYALVINSAAVAPYTSKATADFTVEAVKKAPAPQSYDKVSFKLKVHGQLLKKKTNLDDEEIEGDVDPIVQPWIADGSLNGTMYTASVNTTANNMTTVIQITAVFNDSFDMITSYTMSGSSSTDDYTITMTASGTNVPYSGDLTGWKIFRLSGSDVCSSVTDMTYTSFSKQTVMGQDIVTETELLDFFCNDDSVLIIQFKKE